MPLTLEVVTANRAVVARFASLDICFVPDEEPWFSIEMMNSDSYVHTLNLDNVDPECGELDYLRGEFRQMSHQYVMNNNFAFGGVNTSLIFKRWN